MTQVNPLPRWRGFNLMEKFSEKAGNRPFLESDFAWMAELGFDWVRLPMNYRLWSEPDDAYALREPVLAEIDQALEWGRQYGLHVNVNFHRAPGFSVNQERAEPYNLWTDGEALDCCSFHWRHFAQRYKGVSGERLSFNLFNEPPTVGARGLPSAAAHDRVARHVLAAIREIDPDRPVILDGLGYGNIPLEGLVGEPAHQSCRGYYPFELTHYRAHWTQGAELFPEPTWPMRGGEHSPELSAYYRSQDMVIMAFGSSGRAHLERFYAPWGALIERGVGVHCGEMGALSTVPHGVALAWMADVLATLTGLGIGWALWNFRGSFGPLDSRRKDVQYEDFHGHALDRAMMELLQRY